jgi:hypothetical protein
MASEVSAYPGSQDTFTDKEAKQDLVDKSDINKIQNCIKAIESELGNDPAGSMTDLKSRIAIALAANGAIAQSTSFPTSPTPVEGQVFYRTDLNTMYVYDGANWLALGGSLSNYLFQWMGMVDDDNFVSSASLLGDVSSLGKYLYIYGTPADEGFQTVLTTKWIKIAGVSTVTVHARIWDPSGSENAACKVDIGGCNGNGHTTGAETVPTWVNFTINVSSLTNGTLYDVTIQLGITGPGGQSQPRLGAIIGFGS